MPWLAQVARALCGAAAALILAACAHQGITSDTPLAQVRSVKTLMDAHPGDDFHLVLIHGISAHDRTTWDGFRARLCRHLADRCVTPTPAGPISERLILAAHAPKANYLGRPIWRTDDEWIGSRPFVDHYIFQLRNGGHLIVDEINWWPLAFAFKCQFIVGDETALVGPSKNNITFCGQTDATHFAWLSPREAATLLASRPISGGAPSLNAALKADVLDWGISDAVLSLGTLKGLLRETVRCAFTDISGFNWDQFGGAGPGVPLTFTCGATGGSDQPRTHTRFVIISHSLGAFLLMDTFATAAADADFYQQPGADACRTSQGPALSDQHTSGQAPEQASAQSRDSQSLCLVLAKSDNLYFFANQFALLELARAQGMSEAEVKPASGPRACADALSLWAGCGTRPEGEKQIVAFSDPGDILTFKVPRIEGAAVINVYTHNATDYLGLFESPLPAHNNYLTSDAVLKIVFGD